MHRLDGPCRFGCVAPVPRSPCTTGARVRACNLAVKAQLSPATTSQLVSDLQLLGYLERWPDPAGCQPNDLPRLHGRQTLPDAGNRVAEIEHHWPQLVGDPRFNKPAPLWKTILDKPAACPPTDPFAETPCRS